MPQRTGILYLVSGPSGSGKTTMCRRLADTGEAQYSTSCTTRAPRAGEIEGTDYFFLNVNEFKAKIENGDFLEYAEVHGNFYGTLKSEVLQHLAQGSDVVMDIDVQGAESVRTCRDTIIQAALVDLFIRLDSEEELRARLTNRGTDNKETIDLRLSNSLEEMAHWPKYSFNMISKTKEEDFNNFFSLLKGQRLLTARQCSL